MTIRNESLHQDRNDDGVRIAHFSTSKNLVFKCIMFPHKNICENTWTSLDGKTHNQIDHKLIDSRWHLSILDTDADHYLVVTEVKERLAVSKEAAQKFDVERFNHRKLSELEVIKEYQIWISNRFAVLESFNDSEGINRALETKRTS